MTRKPPITLKMMRIMTKSVWVVMENGVKLNSNSEIIDICTSEVIANHVIQECKKEFPESTFFTYEHHLKTSLEDE